MLSHNTPGNHLDNYHLLNFTGKVLPLHKTKSLLLTVGMISFTCVICTHLLACGQLLSTHTAHLVVTSTVSLMQEISALGHL